MNREKHYKLLEQMYGQAPIHSFYLDISLKVEDHKSTVTLPVRKEFCHAGAAVHGSVYFKLLDDAAYFAVQSVVHDYFIVTTQFDIQLLRPVTSGTLIAIGEAHFIANNLFAATAELRDEKGRLIAKGQGQFMKSKMALEDVFSN